MKTNKQKNDSHSFQDLDNRIEQILTPRFAPSANDIKLEANAHPSSRTLWLNILRFGSVAAALVIGMFVLIGPTNKVVAKTPEDVIAEALTSLQTSDTYRVDFQMNAKENSDIMQPYEIDPNGERISGTLTILRYEGKEYMRIEWSNNIVQLFDGGQMRYKMWRNGELVCDMERSTINLKLLKLASLDDVKAIFGNDEDMKMQIEEQGDNIHLRAMIEHGEIAGIFSREQGKLLECGARAIDKTGTWKKVLSAKIEYNHPITVEQITASPK
ncbi:MAG: hypothetical protein J6L01_06260 [Alistipes sp.]|nr:hypothetical protein [Alistipes sp.]